MKLPHAHTCLAPVGAQAELVKAKEVACELLNRVLPRTLVTMALKMSEA